MQSQVWIVKYKGLWIKAYSTNGIKTQYFIDFENELMEISENEFNKIIGNV